MTRTWLIFILFIIYTNGQNDRKSSLTFVVDVTHSMKKVIKEVERHAHAIFDAVVESNETYIGNFVLVTFADTDKIPINVDNVTDTTDRNVFKDSLNLNLVSGVNCPEKSISGIQTGIENSVPGSTIYVFTDASASDYKKYEYVKDLALKKEIQVIFILTGMCKHYNAKGVVVYDKLARDTSGQVFNLQLDDIKDIIKYILNNLKSRRINLATKSFPAGKGTFNYTTDHATSDTTLDISCLNAILTVTGPGSEILKVKVLVNLKEILMVKVNETKVGNHTVTIDCKSNSRIIASAKSNIQFRHGFSAFIPTSLNDTTVKPFPDGKTYLSIKVVGNFLPQTVRLLDAFDTLVPGYILPLKALNETQKLFITEPLDIPKFVNMFRIVVTGVDLDHNETIIRIGSTLVEPQRFIEKPKPKKPAISIGGPKITVERDIPLQLKCLANAFPKPTITWEKNGIILEKDVFVFDLPYDYISVHKIEKANENATYKCKATNSEGADTQSLNIEVKSGVVELTKEAPIINKTSKFLEFDDGTKANISCRIISGTPKPTIQWLHKNSDSSLFEEITEAKDNEDLLLTNVTRKQEGSYKCVATNPVGSDTMEWTVTVKYAPSVDKDSKPTTVKAGEQVTLSCSADGFPDPDIIWSKDDKPLNDSKFDSSSKNWLIFKADLGDSGIYKCHASNELGSDNKTNVVEVHQLPSLLMKGSNPIDAEYGKPLNITCQVLGYPKPDIVWIDLSTNSILDAEEEEQTPYQFASYLNIDKITGNATYQCKANNTLGGVEEDVDITTEGFEVLESPTDTTYDVPYNGQAKFTCKVDAYPSAEVNWYKHGKILLKDDISVSSDGFELTIKHMQPDDAGEFMCEVKNIHNMKMYPFKIQITGVAKPKISVTEKLLQIPEYTDTKLSCRIENGIPTPTIQWYYSDTVSGVIVEIKEAKDNEDLSLTNVNRKQEGSYKCVATNPVGSDTMEWTVTVKYAPSVNKDSKPTTVKAGEQVTLTCSADGLPDPDIIWSKDDKPLNDSKFDSSSKNRLIFKADLGDSGIYKCHASNELGSDNKTNVVEVHQLPSILMKGSNLIDAEYGKPLNITCQVLGYPKPDIVWIDLSTNSILDAEEEEQTPYQFASYLNIDKITGNATYQCKANNTLGGVEEDVDITTEGFEVLESPTDTSYDLPYNGQAKFTCKVDAYPSAEVNWYKHGKILSKDDISVSPDGSELTIKHMQPDDAGEFMCEVKNIHNMKMYPFKIQITGVAKPKISVTEKLLQVPEYTDTKLSCRIENGIPKPIIQWYYNDTVSGVIVEVKEAKDNEDLSLTNVNRKQEGSYKCVATNPVGSDTMEWIVIVKYAPSVDKDSKPTTVKAGEQVTLTCSADGFPEPDIIWSKDDKPLNGSKFDSSSKNRLMFKADLGDSGIYKCHASNELGSDNKTNVVEVHQLPSILMKGSYPIDAEYGKPLNITCQVLGYPKPDIVWIDLSTNSILDAEEEEQTPYQFASYLNIDKITGNATYQCKANNTLGGVEEDVDITTEGFEVLESPTDTTYDVPYNGQAKFTCKVDAYPSAEVNWYKHGKILSKDDISVSSDGFELTIKHMQPDDAGEFMCEVKNIHNMKMYPFKIQITGVAKPKISVTEKLLQIPEYTDTKLSCRIENGIPTPKIQWYYSDTVSGVIVEIKEAKDNEDLSLTNVNRKQEGSYKCVATNPVGSDTMEWTVTVKYAPSVDKDSKPTTVKAGEQVTLTCSADGFPEPDIIWSKDDKPLNDSKFDSSSKNRLIFKADLGDSGIYKCHASNELGSDNKTNVVEVHQLPSILMKGINPIDAEYGKPLNITCQVLGYPKPDIVWIDLSTNSILDAEEEEQTPYQFASYLNIDKITGNATYQCKANNTLGGVEEDVDITTEGFEVLESPTDTTYDVPYNGQAKFTCKVDAYPSAEVNWYKHGKILSKDDISVSSDGFELTIKHMQPDDAGEFMCEVKNIHNMKMYPFKIQITGVAKPKISVTEKLLQIPEYTDTKLSCRIENGIPTPKIQWYYSDTVSGVIVEIKEAKDNEDLSLTNVNRKQEGSYKCVATNPVGSDTMEWTVTVKYAPSVDKDSKPTTVKAGEQVTLTCSADGFPEPDIIWSKDDKPLNDSKFDSSSKNRLIFKADLGDSGIYKCHASNELGSDNKTNVVEVHQLPSILMKGINPIDAEYGKPLNITCQVLGYPKPDIVWIDLSTNSILDAEEEEQTPYQFASYLNIDKITGNATYQCKANNTLGGVEEDVDITTEGFEVLESPTDTTYDVPYNGQAKFTCKVDAYPSAEVNWYKHGKILSKDDISVSSDGFELTIKHMQPDDAGEFMCEVKNIHNMKMYPFKIQITGVAKPKISVTEKLLQIPEYTDTKLSCRIENGIPTPTIQWYYSDTVSGVIVEIKEAKDNEDLSLTNVNRKQEGSYKCVATNPVGSDTMEWTVTVKYAPSVDKDSKPTTVKAGEQVTLTCSADGFPEPDIIWCKDDKPLNGSKFDSSSKNRLIFKADLGDSGIYKCHASNELGSDNKTNVVEVHQLPSILMKGINPIDAEYGKPLNITCQVLGYPKPDIVWIDLSTNSILDAEEEEQTPYQFASYLNIDKITGNATYQCKANNTLGGVEEDVDITTEGFEVLESPTDTSYDLPYNGQAKFTCKVDAYPSAEVNWYKHGKILSKDDISVSSDGFELTIKHMQPDDAGEFMCEVKNIHNMKMYPFKIQITGVAKPKISVTEKLLQVPEYTDTKLSCRIENGIPKPTIQWYYNDTVSGVIVEVKEAKDNEDLSLTNVNRKQEGSYKCVATNPVGSDTMEWIVIVKYAPSVDKDSKPTTVKAGEQVTLTCSADGFPDPDIIWSKDDKPLNDSKFDSSNKNRLIFKVDLGDSGIYKCHASNELGSDYKTSLVEVTILPTVIIEGKPKQQVDFNEALDLKCNVHGYPAPDIRWLDTTNHVVLLGSTSIVKLPYEYLSVLSINKVNKNATYQCEAKNILGNNKALVLVEAVKQKHLNITEEPKDTIIPYNTEGKLYCKVDAYPPAKITWYKEWKLVSSRNGVKISPNGSTLTFENMQPNQQGKYICLASNSYSKEIRIAKVTTSGLEMPQILKKPEEKHSSTRKYHVKEGTSSFSLSCKIAKGIPKPTIKWFVKNKSSTTFIEIKEAVNQESLLITNLLRNKSEIYQCKAYNFIGLDLLNMDLQVEYPPTIKDDKIKYPVKSGDIINVPCSVDGNPKPTVTWSKVGGKSDFAKTPDHNFRLITNLGDSGDYTCTATNEYGKATRNVTIEVYSIYITGVGDKNQILSEYEALELECDKYGNPEPIVEWFYDGTIDDRKIPPVFLDRGDILSIDSLSYEQRGRYTCAARNRMGGHAAYSFEIYVNYVRIHNIDNIIKAVDGDMMLSVFCNATGNSKLSFRWTVDGAPKREDRDTLLLHERNVKKYDSSDIVCRARNDAGDVDSFVFKVQVDDYPPLNNPTSPITMNLGESDLVACPVSHNNKDFLRWYKDKKKVHEGELYIRNARYSDAGLYTCRVSNMVKSESANVQLQVELKLKFMNTVETSLSLGFGDTVDLDCMAEGYPIPRVSWYYNGHIISTDFFYTFKMSQTRVGKYKCEVTNSLGSISRIFDVNLNECILKIDPDARKKPLLLTQHFRWPSYKYNAGYMYVPKNQSVLLACTKKLNLFNSKHVTAYCSDTGLTAQLQIDKIPHDYSNIRCKNEVMPQVKWTTKSCMGEESETIKIVYEALGKNVEVYEVCLNLSYYNPLYTKQIMHFSAGSVPKPVAWFDDRLKYDFNNLYDTDEQITVIGSILSRLWHKDDRCVFSKKQLVNPLDVFPGVPQRATFTHFNVAPHWSTCSSENWDEVEFRVRKLAQSGQLTVWTGTAEGLQLRNVTGYFQEIFLTNLADGSNQPVPMYLWKVVQNPAKRQYLAIIQLNIPDLTSTQAMKYVKCRNICQSTIWMRGRQWSDVSKGYTFCCEINEFEIKFGYRGLDIFGRDMKHLLLQ